jgi:hypothetical protein
MSDIRSLAPLVVGLLVLPALLVWADAVDLAPLEKLRAGLAALPSALATLGERWDAFLTDERGELAVVARTAADEQELARAAVLAAENQALREQLGLRLRSPWRLLTVELTANRPPTVDAGASDGLRGGEALIIDGRLAGVVGGLADDYAEIVPLARAGACGARLVSCRADGVAEYIEGELLVRHLGSQTLPRQGELAVTNGLGRLPAGIPLGRVTRVDWEPGALDAACSLGRPADPAGAEFGQLVLPVTP